MNVLLTAEPGKKLLLLGNEAIVRGALEAGVAVATAYPGTPSSEIADTFFQLAKETDLYFEYSTNEKVALEIAAGAAIAGMRSIVSMKHVGLNVAADPLNTLAYTGVRAGMVIVTADDPSMHSSQNEQDNRFYSKLSLLPMLEPSHPAEALQMTQQAFALSEKLGLPVLLRTTTRVNHTRGVCRLGDLIPREFKGHFEKEILRWVPVPAVARRLRPIQLQKQEQAAKLFEPLSFNRIEGQGPLGIVSAGIPVAYVKEALQLLEANAQVSLLQVGSIHPLPRKLMEQLLRTCQKVLVVEELEPYLETELRALAQELGLCLPIEGKGPQGIPRHYELSVDRILPVLGKFLGRKVDVAQPISLPPLPDRPPLLCAGCTHRTSYYAIKAIAEPDTYFASDIGCYTLGLLPPLSTTDSFLCMGSSITQASGAAIGNKQKIVAFIGDSTFFHSGLPGLVNAVHNQHDLMLIILDNGTTAMTGHQPHPGAQLPGNAMVCLDLERAVRGLGVEDVTMVDPANLRETILVAQQAYQRKGVRVIISRHPCPLYEKRILGIKEARLVYTVDPDRCKTCGSTGTHEPCGVSICKDDELLRSRAKILAATPVPDTQPLPNACKSASAPCTLACPANICAMGYVSLARVGRFREALQLIRESAPLPKALGRVCHHPCESYCVRGEYDQPIAINEIKRFVAEQETPDEALAYFAALKAKIKPKGKKVAVVGAGPAGLSAAFELCLRGYQVTLFEKEEVAGGLLAWGIPPYRMPRELLAGEIRQLLSLGIELRTGVSLGKEIKLSDLLGEGYAGVCLALGCAKGLRTGIKGETTQGVVDALTFLRQVHLEGLQKVGRRVAVVGGGDAAIDAARTAVRLGASSVEILYRRSEKEMPAAADEILAAQEEGVAIRTCVVPTGCESKDGRVSSLECVCTELSDPDESGRKRPVPKSGSEFEQEADLVVLAVGQEPDLSWLNGDLNLETAKPGVLKIDDKTCATSHPKIFAAGDFATGPKTVIAAIASGRLAAYGIDCSLSSDEEAQPLRFRSVGAIDEASRYHPGGVLAQSREQPGIRLAEERKADQAPVSQGLSKTQTLAESDRCLGCGLCARCNNCIDNFGCPAIYKRDGRIFIDEVLCVGCGICAKLCANDAIVVKG